MTDFYLITGFLGAGKTTFLKNFIRLFPAKTIRLIVNEFGKEGVDGTLLAEVGAVLKEVNGGSVFCSCRSDQFEAALSEGLSHEPDLLIVEASGLSDPTNIRHIMEDKEWAGRIRYRGCICLVDAVRLPKVFTTARVCQKQLAVSDLLLLNKTDLATPEQLAYTHELIAGRFTDTALHETAHGAVQWAWIDNIDPNRRPNDPDASRPDITIQRATVTVSEQMTQTEITHFIKMFAEDSCRIKGFVYTCSDGWLLADCVGAMVRLTPWQGAAPKESGLNVLATAGMPLRKALNTAVKWYLGRATVLFG